MCHSFFKIGGTSLIRSDKWLSVNELDVPLESGTKAEHAGTRVQAEHAKPNDCKSSELKLQLAVPRRDAL